MYLLPFRADLYLFFFFQDSFYLFIFFLVLNTELQKTENISSIRSVHVELTRNRNFFRKRRTVVARKFQYLTSYFSPVTCAATDRRVRLI